MWGQIYQDKYYEEKRISIIGIDICQNIKSKNKEYQVWLVLKTLWAKFPPDLQSIFKVLSDLSQKHHPIFKAIMRE